MNTTEVKIRPLMQGDFEPVVTIDAKVFNRERREYYERKFDQALDRTDRLVTSLVAEVAGNVVGFVMSELFVGEFGIPETAARLDTIGVDPDYQGKRIGNQLLEEFVAHLKKAGVDKIHTLVDWNDWQLIRFFSANGFTPAKTLNLELDIV